MPLEKIQNTSPKVPELVMQALISAMESGTIQLGDVLPSERDLAETLGIGRGSLRECLAVLEFLGTIESRGNRKAVIRDAEYIRKVISLVRLSSQNNIQEDFNEFRRINEVAIVELACKNATEEDLEALQRALESMEREPLNHVYEIEFHDALAVASHNVMLSAMMRLVNSMIVEIRERFMDRPDYLRITHESHKAIYEAVRDRDVTRAKREMKNHLLIPKRYYREYPDAD